ncbi:dTMP kinase [Alkalithermobacter thermoalcaliphilus JW-YL-7 = DSM 7308]|uniref:Thymidylate kinase n=1 Tax=Alkalithermobacter thermoalcaliphilus JW-YL-7 = DSM 7308 TaxID=1121328 RepID=A0A150FST3_CLOPD|nr:Thymidylate kinase [[Clostridium] paradoxum JW-YL-7 = DSM 7308]SHL20092.1 dTMP kinase [[Clostridium] paradoxum JW-YL-7 = DSM 7308]
MNGFFITFEGPDACGKSTQINLLKNYFQDKGYDVVVTREPGGTLISEKIRALILDKENKNMSYKTEALLYAASRAQHIDELIKPSLLQGKIVICDRFIDSSLIYQGIGRNLGIDKIYNLNLFAIEDTLPDITIIFQIEEEEIQRRKNRRKNLDRLECEKDEFHKKVYEGYKILKDIYPERIKNVDANGTVKQVHERIIKLIQNAMEK